MSYNVLVKFSRELQDDCPIVDDKPEYYGCSYRFALKEQFHAELQEAYDRSEGALAGMFDIVSVESDDKKVNKTLDDAVIPADPLRAALTSIRYARDYCAEYGEYPNGTVGEDQEFDDWAADIAEKALGVGKKPKSTTKLQKAPRKLESLITAKNRYIK